MKKWLFGLIIGSCLLGAQDYKAKPRWRAILYRTSLVALTVATAADVGSSWGGREMTPFLRSADGRFGARGATIKFGMLGGILATEFWMKKKYPNSDGAIMAFNASMAAVSTKIAIDNIGVQRRAARR